VDQQTADWEKIKAKERAGKAQQRTLDGVAVNLPALTRAVKLQNRAARVGFDWPNTSHVVDKIKEEAAELVEAREELSQEEIAEEFGDLMFVMANLARHLELDPVMSDLTCNSSNARTLFLPTSAILLPPRPASLAARPTHPSPFETSPGFA